MSDPRERPWDAPTGEHPVEVMEALLARAWQLLQRGTREQRAELEDDIWEFFCRRSPRAPAPERDEAQG